MITLTRLSGSVFLLNADLIERVDATPDTVVTLVDGTKYVVTESLAEIVVAVQEFRAHIIAVSHTMTPNAPGGSTLEPDAGSAQFRPSLAPVSPIYGEK